jgi:hypothetical protein
MISRTFFRKAAGGGGSDQRKSLHADWYDAPNSLRDLLEIISPQLEIEVTCNHTSCPLDLVRLATLAKHVLVLVSTEKV